MLPATIFHSLRRMWGHVNNLLVWGIFSSVTFQNTALDCETIKSKRFPSPILNAETTVVTMGQNVSLFCSHKNKSLEITYYLFLNTKVLGDQTGKMERAVFNISISKNKDLGPYKCKAGSFNCTRQAKYSQELNFTIVDGDSCPLCLQLLLPVLLLLLLLAVALILGFWIRRRRKARKTMRKNELQSHQNTPEEAESYANIAICKTEAEPGPSLELFYATPVFHNQASEQQEAYGYCEADCTYLNVKTQRAGM
ncbi:allergin-1 isoform X1 [Ochotona curzoniae]|uniref:allergin-1 isoform X1 n=1 Tax=Ochotona curzoniae TaxID=130825 RepID=UPI001B347D2A|nr:allergin-1 isoform X1 [Ochotona curzoniae]